MAKEPTKKSGINIEAFLTLDKETKNKYRFKEIDSDGDDVDFANATIGTVYLPKSGFEGKPPARLKVTIAEG